jgi:hypothetical protein
VNEIDDYWEKRTAELTEGVAYWKGLAEHQSGLRLLAEERSRVTEEAHVRLRDAVDDYLTVCLTVLNASSTTREAALNKLARVAGWRADRLRDQS